MARNSITIEQLKNSSTVFASLSERHLIELEAQDLIRTYSLEKQESVSFIGGSGKDSFYLINGSMHFDINGISQGLFIAGQAAVAIELELGQSAHFSANEPSILCRTDRERLDYLCSWNALIDNFDNTINHGIQERLRALKNPAVFMRLPFENVEEAFKRMMPIEVSQGEQIISQGDTGDTFYIIEHGEAEVWQQSQYDNSPKLVAQLGCGDSFGDEALIIESTRNASIKMASSGRLLALHKNDFNALIQTQLSPEVDAQTALSYIQSGYQVIDVRHVEEYELEHLPNVRSIPLHNLRQCLQSLDNSKKYLCYCSSGNRAAAAAMIMNQKGFSCVCLKGGIRQWPYELVTSKS